MNKEEDPTTAKRLKLDCQNGNNQKTCIDNGKPDLLSKLVINPIAQFKREDNEGQDSFNECEDVEECTTSYYNDVNSEELKKLREFQVLDEVNDEDSKDEDSDGSDKSDDFPDDEIEKMLDEDLPEGFKAIPKPKEKPYISRQKIVLEEKGINHFEVLPLDWLMVPHCSGMPVYMHRGSRVCTLSKPYFLGKGNVRRHDIPISAIPCLAYRKALEEEDKLKEIDKSIAEQIRNHTSANNPKEIQLTNENDTQPSNSKAPEALELETSSTCSGYKGPNSNRNKSQPGEKNEASDINASTDNPNVSKNAANENPGDSKNYAIENSNKSVCPINKDVIGRKPVVLPGGNVMPPPRVETVNTSWKSQHLPPEQVNDYCKKLFKFKTVNVMHFKRWADRRKYVKIRKTLQYPTLPEGTKLITIPAQNADGQESSGKVTKRDWVMNMNGSSYLSVFHEYVRRAFHKQPIYEFKQLENAATPYKATVFIGGMQYGVGLGSSKRTAKSAAARASIHILIPEMKDVLDEHTRNNPDADVDAVAKEDPDFSFFDLVGIEDPRIQEFCSATSEPSPHAILRTCLVRNFGAGDRHIQTEIKKIDCQKVQKIELIMKVGKHTATVVCKNKKLAKQRASQSILQQLHPHISSWGSLLRLYGSGSVKSCKEKKVEEQKITLLQDKAKQNEPNYAVLAKLRSEMMKLKERDEGVVPIGTLLVAESLPTNSGSMLNNVDM